MEREASGDRARRALAKHVKKTSVLEVAKLVGCSRKSIYAYLWGTRIPGTENAVALERIAEIPVAWWTR